MKHQILTARYVIELSRCGINSNSPPVDKLQKGVIVKKTLMSNNVTCYYSEGKMVSPKKTCKLFRLSF